MKRHKWGIFCGIILVGMCCVQFLRPRFVLNPSGKTPLSGVYKIPFTNTEPLTLIISGQRNDADIVHTFPAGYGKEFPIHGLYPKATNQITILYKNTTKTISADIKEVTVNDIFIPVTQVVSLNKTADSECSNDIYFISASIGEKHPLQSWVILGYSRNGNLRYLNIDDTARLNELQRIVPNNNEMILITDVGAETLLGKNLLDLTNKHKVGHHDRVKKGDHFISLANSKWGDEDRVLELDAAGNIVRDLSAGDLVRKIVLQENNPNDLKQINHVVFDDKNIYITSQGKKHVVDWAHINSVVYDDKTDILYLSFRNLGVVAVQYTAWEMIWWMVSDKLDFVPPSTPVGGTQAFFDSLKSLQDYRVKADGITDGPKHQHALFLWGHNHLGMFDNRGYSNNKSRYVEYVIHGQPGNWTAKKVYEYFDPSLADNNYTSDVDILPNGNLLILYGMEKAVVEVDKKSQEKLYQLNFSLPAEMLYRVDKMPFYPIPGKEYPKEHKL